MNSNESEPIRNNPSLDLFGLILIENSVWINPSSDCFGLIMIEKLVRIHPDWCLGLNRIDFRPFLIKQDTKCFSDWFRVIRISWDTDIGMNRNSSDQLGINFYSKISPGILIWINDIHGFSRNAINVITFFSECIADKHALNPPSRLYTKKIHLSH